MSRTGNKRAFTLIEVMVTVSVLSLGLLLLYHSFFVSMDAMQYASNRLNAQIWLEGKIWEESDVLRRTKALPSGTENGVFQFQGRDFSWKRSVAALETNLYSLTVTLSWKESGRQRELAYATYLLCPAD